MRNRAIGLELASERLHAHLQGRAFTIDEQAGPDSRPARWKAVGGYLQSL